MTEINNSNDYDIIPILKPLKVKYVFRTLSEALSANHKLMGVDKLWKITKGKGVKVAILDSGVPDHPDLKVAGGKSFVHDYYYDTHGHSTHCGGILAAIEGNGIGIAGIAPEAEVYYGAVLGPDGSGSIHSIVNGIIWAVDDLKVDVISMSLGIADTPFEFHSLRKACDHAWDNGVAIFAAAGNEAGEVGQPARYPSTISVGAISKGLKHAKFSNTGATVDFVSVGVDVYSTWLNNSYCCLDGTSMACPAVAGLGALLISEARLRGEDLKPAELKKKLADMSRDLGEPGKDYVFGFGIPDATRVV